jgi:predicted metalloprotease with PDZ domain
MTRCAGAFLLSATLAILASAASASAQGATSPVMTLVVDESQAPRRIAFVHEQIQVRPGALSLAYPKWIPGEHGPTGPIKQFAVLQIHSGKTPLPWTRDPEEINTIHFNVPPGTNAIDVDFDTLVENTISDHQLFLAWNTAVLYPRGIDKTKLMIQPSVILPRSWKQASSLTVTSESGDRVNFAPVSLERLIDSPVLASSCASFRSPAVGQQNST